MPGIAAVNGPNVVIPRSRGWVRPRARPRLWAIRLATHGAVLTIRTALADGALLTLLVAMTVLLVMCIGAVIVAPPPGPGSDASRKYQATEPPLPLPLPGRPPPAAPSRPLPRRPPPVTAPPRRVGGWSSADADTGEVGALPPLMRGPIPRPQVSGKPPWGPAPKPPGPEPWAADNPPA
jgi:hypothetical protein